jgi:hypothetical protein
MQETKPYEMNDTMILPCGENQKDQMIETNPENASSPLIETNHKRFTLVYFCILKLF